MNDTSPERILEQLNAIVGKIIKKEVSLTTDTHVIAHQILDSLDFMDYVFQIQDSFSVDIPDEDLEQRRLGVIGNMIQYLQECQASPTDSPNG